MKKLLTTALFCMLLVTAGWAQKTSEGSEKSPLGDSGPCLIVEVEGQKDNVEDVMADKFKKLKTGKKKGYVTMEEQIWEEVSPNTLDMYYKVEKSGDNKTKVFMFLSQGYDNWMTSSTHPDVVNKAKSVLDGLAKEVRVYELTIAIEAQTKVLEEAMKVQEDLEKDQEKLAKEKEKLEEDLKENKTSLEENASNQEASKKAIGEEKKMLEELQNKLGQVK